MKNTSASRPQVVVLRYRFNCLCLAFFHLFCVRGIPPLRSTIIEHGKNTCFAPVFQEIFIPDFLSHMPHPLRSCSDWPVSGIYSPCTNPYVIRAGGPRSSYISLWLFPPPCPFPLLTLLLLTRLASFLLLTRLLLRLLRSVA